MTGPRILCVDRDVELLRTLAVVLGHCGHVVATARGHAEALRLARDEPPDVVVAPQTRQPDDLDGAALVRALRGAPRRTLLAAIFLTDDLDLAPALDGFGLGSDVRLLRPFDFAALAEHIARAAERVAGLHVAVAARLAASDPWRGDLAQVGPAAALTLIAAHAGDLELRRGPAVARLTVHAGQLTAATLADPDPAAVRRDLAAVEAALTWSSGQFTFTPGPAGPDAPLVSIADALAAAAAERPT